MKIDSILLSNLKNFSSKGIKARSNVFTHDKNNNDFFKPLTFDYAIKFKGSDFISNIDKSKTPAVVYNVLVNARQAENQSRILANRKSVEAKKLYDEARNQYVACKQKVDEETKAYEPEKLKIKKELAELEKSVEPEIMAEYKKKRNDNIFPVIVPLEGNNFCGRCRMELPKVAISRLKEKGVITCEHCKRFIYLKTDK